MAMKPVKTPTSNYGSGASKTTTTTTNKATTRTSSSGATHGGTSGSFGTPTSNYGYGASKTTTPTTVVTPVTVQPSVYGYGASKNDNTTVTPTTQKSYTYSSSDRQTISDLVNDGYYNELLEYFKDKNEEARKSAIAAIMQRLNTLKGMYGTQLDELDEEYQALINQSEVQRYKSKSAIREALANRGQLDSGLGRQEQLYLDTKYGNQTTNLKAQRQKAKQDIQNLINQAIAEAEADKASTNNTYNNALLQYELANS